MTTTGRSAHHPDHPDAPDPVRIDHSDGAHPARPAAIPVPADRAAADPAVRPRLGYGTNGLTDLRLDDALGLLADLGYDGVGLTLDHMHLDPLAPTWPPAPPGSPGAWASWGSASPSRPAPATSSTPAANTARPSSTRTPRTRAARVRLLLRAVRVAADLGAHAVHCFSGTLPADTPPDEAWKRLASSLTPVLTAAEAARVPLAVEPEPGHLLATLGDFHHLRGLLGDPAPALLGLTLDIGHCQCLEPLPPADCVRAAAPWVHHVQIEDMRRGVHEHLPFGDGEIDFPPVLAALTELTAAGFPGLTVVELPRHSHAGPELARTSLSFLRPESSSC
ncbi:sugar phosphate isomerase/epimerase family protein [Streptomyces sp. Qhu_M48]|uniref:sugar phosphate isomerase/epimerase family protein n=1 Tax=Streptomyces sp. Qhu_M48 TaxID=3435889 RepID=UPI003F50961F